MSHSSPVVFLTISFYTIYFFPYSVSSLSSASHSLFFLFLFILLFLNNLPECLASVSSYSYSLLPHPVSLHSPVGNNRSQRILGNHAKIRGRGENCLTRLGERPTAYTTTDASYSPSFSLPFLPPSVASSLSLHGWAQVQVLHTCGDKIEWTSSLPTRREEGGRKGGREGRREAGHSTG